MPVPKKIKTYDKNSTSIRNFQKTQYLHDRIFYIFRRASWRYADLPHRCTKINFPRSNFLCSSYLGCFLAPKRAPKNKLYLGFKGRQIDSLSYPGK